jgi:hypothetical protein
VVEEMGKADMMVICELFLEIGEKKEWLGFAIGFIVAGFGGV